MYYPGRLTSINLSSPSGQRWTGGIQQDKHEKEGTNLACNVRNGNYNISSDNARVKQVQPSLCVSDAVEKLDVSRRHQGVVNRSCRGEENEPFYLRIIDQGYREANGNHRHVDGITSSGSNASNCAVRADRRLQHLISLTSLIPDKKTSKGCRVKFQTPISNRRFAEATAVKDKHPCESGNTSGSNKANITEDPDDMLSNKSMSMSYMDVREQYIKTGTAMSLSSWIRQNGAGKTQGNLAPGIVQCPGVSERFFKRKVQVPRRHRAAVSEVPPQTGKVKVEPTIHFGICAYNRQGQQSEKDQSLPANTHSKVWGDILRKRNRTIRRTGPPGELDLALPPGDTNLCECTYPQLIHSELQENVQNHFLHRENYFGAQVNLDSDHEEISGDTCNDGNGEKTNETISPDDSDDEIEDNDSIKHLASLEVVCEANVVCAQKPRSLLSPRKGELSWPDNSSLENSLPAEVFYPLYAETFLDESRVNGNATWNRSETKGSNKLNHKKICKASSGFWLSLVNGERKNDNGCKEMKKIIPKTARQKRDIHSQRKASGCKDVKPLCCSEEDKTVSRYHLDDEVQLEVEKTCRKKGYEIVRKLRGGQFGENVVVYLANNEGRLEYSPVEITVVKLPTKSVAQSFMEAFTVDARPLASLDRHQYESKTGCSMLSDSLTSHKNLLLRLHVFISGVCIYQVTNYCQWPTLSHLLEFSPSSTSNSQCDNGCSDIAAGKCVRYSVCGITFNQREVEGARINGTEMLCERCTIHGHKQLLDESMVKTIFRQICDGLMHLHNHGVLHGDLKCSNVLVNEKLEVKLTGYGPCCLHTLKHARKCPTFVQPITDPYDVYIPPEMMAKRSYRGWAKSSDIWCLGMTLLHMTVGEVSHQLNSAVRLRRSKQFKTLCVGQLTYQLGLLLESLLQVHPQDRPSITDLTGHAWFSDGTDIASELSLTKSTMFRTDGRTFPLPKRIHQALFQLKKSDAQDTDIDEARFGIGKKGKRFSTNWSCSDEEEEMKHDINCSATHQIKEINQGIGRESTCSSFDKLPTNSDDDGDAEDDDNDDDYNFDDGNRSEDLSLQSLSQVGLPQGTDLSLKAL